MSKKYYKPIQEEKSENLEIENEVIEETVADQQEPEVEAEELAEEIVEESEVAEEDPVVFFRGIVANCKLLNVREKPDKESNSLCVIKEGDEVQIKMSESSDNWYKVVTVTGIEGYCMKQYMKKYMKKHIV